jgi:hypothetical protein
MNLKQNELVIPTKFIEDLSEIIYAPGNLFLE